MTEVVQGNDKEAWNSDVVERGGHPLQLWGWGAVKEAHGWQAHRLYVKEGEAIVGMAQVLLRKLPEPFKVLAYIPRGPICTEPKRKLVLDTLASYVKKYHGAVALTVEPDWEGELSLQGWKRSANTIQIPRTLILDLSLDDEALQADMTKKTRQYIRKSAKEVEVRQVKGREELERCLAIYHQTAERAGFPIHDDTYYYDVYEKLGEYSPVFVAVKNDEIVAFLWLAISGETAFELYGGMNEAGQELRANYILKWHTIQAMKKWGIRRYDMNGLLNDGVSTFKQGFAQHENMLVGTYDRPLSPLYGIWSKGLPLAKKIVRTIKRR